MINYIFGAIIGGAGEAIWDFGKQIADLEKEEVDWRHVGGTAARGAIIGACAGGALAGRFLKGAITVASASAIGGLVERKINNRRSETVDVASDFAAGGLGSVASRGMSFVFDTGVRSRIVGAAGGSVRRRVADAALFGTKKMTNAMANIIVTTRLSRSMNGVAPEKKEPAT